MFHGLLWVLTGLGVLAVVGSFFLLRAVPAEIRPVAIAPLVVVLAGFTIGFLLLAGVLG